MLLVAGPPALVSADAVDTGSANEATPAPDSIRGIVQEGIRRTLAGQPAAARELWAELSARDPSEPAAPVFDAYTLFSLQVSDEYDTEFDAEIAQRAEQGIRLARARVVADDTNADAHFLLGQALFHRARLKGIRGQLLSAGSDGEEARDHFERAVALRPALVDAKLPLGMWYYYAGRLPSIIKWMSWLWFIPTGDSAEGLRFLREVYDADGLYRSDAAFMLMNIYTFYEPDYPQAFGFAEELVESYPNNLLVRNEYLELLVEACRFREAIEEAQRVEALPADDPRRRAHRRMARIPHARAELYMGRPERARQLLEEFGPEGPERPYWGSAWVGLVRAQSFDVQGDRARALEGYERVAALEPPRGSERAGLMAKQGLASPFEAVAPTCAPAISATGG